MREALSQINLNSHIEESIMSKHSSFRLCLLSIAALATVGAAHATNFGNEYNTNNNQTYNQGGSGGSAAAVAGASSAATSVSGAAAGAAVVGSGNSSVENSVKNSNANYSSNLQGQQQGQGQQQSNRSSNRNDNTSSASVGGNNSNLATGATSQQQGVTVDARNQSVYQAQERNPVNSAYAAGLTSSNGTCMGSSSFGATGPGFSASVGSTWKDSDCSIRYTAEALRASGNNAIAQALLCQIAEVKKVAPKHCRAVETALADPDAAMENKVAEIQKTTVGTAGPSTTDPYIAARLAKQGK